MREKLTLAGRRRIERRCSVLETKLIPDRDPWRPCGESNPGLRVEGPANSPLFYRDRCSAAELQGALPSGAPESNRYDEVGDLACCL